MRFALGMDNREIARALGRSDGATKVLIHRAIKQLEELVAAAGGREEQGRRVRVDRDGSANGPAPRGREDTERSLPHAAPGGRRR
jgi:RNA polymerase sigma-70 factor (ECF subfamily)